MTNRHFSLTAFLIFSALFSYPSIAQEDQFPSNVLVEGEKYEILWRTDHNVELGSVVYFDEFGDIAIATSNAGCLQLSKENYQNEYSRFGDENPLQFSVSREEIVEHPILNNLSPGVQIREAFEIDNVDSISILVLYPKISIFLGTSIEARMIDLIVEEADCVYEAVKPGRYVVDGILTAQAVEYRLFSESQDPIEMDEGVLSGILTKDNKGESIAIGDVLIAKGGSVVGYRLSSYKFKGGLGEASIEATIESAETLSKAKAAARKYARVNVIGTADGFYYLRQDNFLDLGHSDSERFGKATANGSPFGPNPTPSQVKAKIDANYYFFPSCVDEGQPAWKDKIFVQISNEKKRVRICQ